MPKISEKIKSSVTLQVVGWAVGGILFLGSAWMAGCWEFAGHAYANVYQVDQNVVTLTEHKAAIAALQMEQQKTIEGIYERLGQMQRNQARQDVLFGLAVKLNCCANDTEPWVRVNENSPAFRFEEGRKLKVTKRGSGEDNITVVVKGTFRADNSAYLVQMNRMAFDLLRVQGVAEVGVKIEPK